MSELENIGISKATALIVEILEKNEDFDKISHYLKEFMSEKEATEGQLKLAIKSQLDRAKIGLEKLDLSFGECSQIQERSKEISHRLISIHSLAHGLDDLQVKSKKQKKLAIARNNMDYLEKVPSLIKQAQDLIDSSNFFFAYKILEELESTRDEILSELVSQECSESDLKEIEDFFRGAEKLNEQLCSHVKWVGERVFDACITKNKVLVNCLRIIVREENNDQMWEKSQIACSLTKNRPKLWKNEFFSAIKSNIKETIREQVSFGKENNWILPRCLEYVRRNIKHNLIIIKKIGVIYFPPHYSIYDEFVRMYHDAISEFIREISIGTLIDSEPYQLLVWCTKYYSTEYMGSSELEININELGITNPLLLNETEYNNLAKVYLDNYLATLPAWFENNIVVDEFNWTADTPPFINGDCHYYTEIPNLALSPLKNITKGENILKYLGEKARETFYPRFFEIFMKFQNDFPKVLYRYKEKYTEYNFCYRVEYLVANCNNFLILDSTFKETTTDHLKNSPALRGKVDPMLTEISNKNFEIAQICLDLIIEILFKDLAPVYAHILTHDWNLRIYPVSNYIIGTIKDYNQIYMFLKLNAYRRLVKAICRRIVVDYIKVLLTRKMKFTIEYRRVAAGTMFYECDKIMGYILEDLHVNDESIAYMNVLKLIANVIQEESQSNLLVKIEKLIDDFPSIQKPQMIKFLMHRGDLKLTEAKEIASKFTYGAKEDPTDLFSDASLSVKKK